MTRSEIFGRSSDLRLQSRERLLQAGAPQQKLRRLRSFRL
jgi:hypothetical protein